MFNKCTGHSNHSMSSVGITVAGISGYLWVSLGLYVHLSFSGNFLTHCGRLNNGPKISMSPCLELINATLCGKRDLAGEVKLRILRRGDGPGLPKHTLKVISSVLIRGRQRGI